MVLVTLTDIRQLSLIHNIQSSISLHDSAQKYVTLANEWTATII